MTSGIKWDWWPGDDSSTSMPKLGICEETQLLRCNLPLPHSLTPPPPLTRITHARLKHPMIPKGPDAQSMLRMIVFYSLRVKIFGHL